MEQGADEIAGDDGSEGLSMEMDGDECCTRCRALACTTFRGGVIDFGQIAPCKELFRDAAGCFLTPRKAADAFGATCAFVEIVKNPSGITRANAKNKNTITPSAKRSQPVGNRGWGDENKKSLNWGFFILFRPLA